MLGDLRCFRVFILLTVVLSVAQALSKNATIGVEPLGPYKVSTVTVSGISSGAYMAVQMHIAYSMIISGAASFAGVRLCLVILSIYWCFLMINLFSNFFMHVGRVLSIVRKEALLWPRQSAWPAP
jgi:hypothetical protein